MFHYFPQTDVPEEGTLYRIIDLHGCSFPIYYGYYDELDRKNPTVDPMPVYPDFVANPHFSADGYRFVTKMQDACSHYRGEATAEKECADCVYYCHGEDLLGMCKYPGQNKSVI